MGSFDATCILSDIGISYGDEVYVFLLCSGNGGRTMGGNRSWYPITYGVPGTYADYGRVSLNGEYPQHILDTLAQFVVPFEQGSNSCHEHAVDPNALTWNSLEEADRQSRLWAQRAPVNYMKMNNAEEEWKHPIQKICDDNDISIRVFPVALSGSTFLYGEIEIWESDKQKEIEDKLRACPEFINSPYQVVSVPKAGVGYSEENKPALDSEDGWYRGLLFAPKLKQHNLGSFFGYTPSDERVRVAIGYVRKDVFDALIVLDRESVEIASLVREKVEICQEYEAKKVSNHWDPDSKYYLRDVLRSLKPNATYGTRRGLSYGGEGHGMSETILTEMIYSSPVDTFEPFNGWVRAIDMYNKSQYSLRKGLQPTVDYAGSQCASEDWPDQLEFHQKMAKICEAAIQENFYICVGTIGMTDGVDFDSFDDFKIWANEAMFDGKNPNLTYKEAMQALKDSKVFKQE